MKKLQAAVLLQSLILGSVPVVAQQPTPTATKSDQIAKPTYVLREGSEVRLKFAHPLTSKTAQEGDTIEFWLDEDVQVGNVTVVKKGARAVGTVTHAKKNGMMGKPGELNISVDYLKLADRKIKLRGTQGREGDDKTGTTVALVVLFGPLGFMKHGKNIEMKEGAPLKVFVGEDAQLPMAD